MASMTDVIFLLLIFFMVTSTFVFPSAIEVNLPQSSEQTAIKPGTRVWIDRDLNLFGAVADQQPTAIDGDELVEFLQSAYLSNPEQFIALYADEQVPYGKIVEVLDAGSRIGVKVVLATKPTSSKRSSGR